MSLVAAASAWGALRQPLPLTVEAELVCTCQPERGLDAGLEVALSPGS